jgi:putative transposase
VVSSDSYNLAVTCYIHNNPKDIDGYRNRPYDYPYSSMGFYTGVRRDHRELIDTGFVINLMNIENKDLSIKRYVEFATRHLDTGNVKSIMQCIAQIKNNITHDERKIILREAKPGQVAKLISGRLELPGTDFFRLRYRRAAADARSFLVFVQRSLCGLGYKELCANLGNMSMTGILRLCDKGFKLYLEELRYREIFQDVVTLCGG